MEESNLNGESGLFLNVGSNLENVEVSDSLAELSHSGENNLIDVDNKVVGIIHYLAAAKKKNKAKSFIKDNNLKTFNYKTYNMDNASIGEIEEFKGFEMENLEKFESHSMIIRKLIGELELINESNFKQRKHSITKQKNIEPTEWTLAYSSDSEDRKLDLQDISIDKSPLKTENLINSFLTINYNKLKKVHSSQETSPGYAIRQKVSVDVMNPAYREPFKYGWRRELVYRAGTSGNQARRMADIYYYTPEGKKVRSYREVIEHLATSQLTIDNFTFFKEPLGVNDSEKEVIREAKKAKDLLNTKATSKLLKKNEEISSTKKKHVKKINTNPCMSLTKVSPRIQKTSSIFKIKLPSTKNPKSPLKKELKTLDTKVNDKEALPFELDASITKKNSKHLGKISSTRTKAVIKKKNSLLIGEDIQQYFMFSVCAGYNALSRIFQYLKVQEILRAARVCRMWRDLAAQRSLWKTVRMKNSQVTDWDGLAQTLKYRETQHLDLRKMLIFGDSETLWKKFIAVIPKVTSLLKLEMCKCPAQVVEDVMANCPQLQTLCATSVRCEYINLKNVSCLTDCVELKLKAISGMSLIGDLEPLLNLSHLKYLSLTSIKELGRNKIDIIQFLSNLVTLELGECSDFSDKFGTLVLIKLQKLEKLRLEKGQGSCCTFDILYGVSKLEKLTQLELVNFDVKNGFDKSLSSCKNIKRLLIIPTYVSQSATSNNMILGGVTELSDSLSHFVWGVTQELLRVTELFVDQCNQITKHITGDSIPILKPVPCLQLIEDILQERNNQKDDKQQSLSNPQVEILPLPHLQKLLLTALPKTRVKILKIPFHATWRQSISDTTLQ